MSTGTLAKVPAKTAAEICNRCALGDEAKELLRPGATPRQFLDALVEKEQFADAVRFLAHALPKREAVWWGCVCVRQVLASGKPPATDTAALQAAEKWVAAPSEENRQEALPAAEATEYGTPAGTLAAAAFFSGGSLAPPDLPAVPPPDTSTANMVAGGVDLAAVQTQPEKAAEKYRKFIATGIEVASGTNRWKETLPLRK